ncbi:hypothetical protein D0865_01654 [Hortaea werneckii]|uniref:Zn(2)-C6 fungal-type domain-containing protein n=1 Tax=Hortaea werneckii TaxID=91943 RepID=A0A3M7D7D5_HORWE|nr:hypothetical protein D0865_01654 [Hortaea werneckii]
MQVAQVLKCDEARPHCGRCKRIGVECPGFARTLKWSRKHEVHTPKPLAPKDVTVDSDCKAEQFCTPESDDAPPSSPREVQWGDLFYDLNPTSELPVCDGYDDPFNQEDTQDSLSVDVSLLDAGTGTNSDPTSLLDMTIAQPPSGAEKQSSALTITKLLASDNLPVTRISHPLFDETTQLIQYYFKEVPQMFAMYDSHKNPFRGTVWSLYGHSLAINYIAQSMAAACLAEVHPQFTKVSSSLRKQALELLENDPKPDYKTLLALLMLGGAASWHDASDIGLPCFKLISNRLSTMVANGGLSVFDNNFLFFQEAMMWWEALLSYLVDPPSLPHVEDLIAPWLMHSRGVIPHPWTGVARDTIKAIQQVGRLVRAQRKCAKGLRFATQAGMLEMQRLLSEAKEIEHTLLSLNHPCEAEIASPDDIATPVWHFVTLAEAQRIVGLLQIYRVFPDLLTQRRAAETGTEVESSWLDDISGHGNGTSEPDEEVLLNLSMKALRLLDSIPLGSGTKEFQLFLLVCCSSELGCPEPAGDDMTGSGLSQKLIEVASMRKVVLDRLTCYLRTLHPKPIRVCLDIARECWRRMDRGEKGVYWMDVMIENGWETLMG